MRLPAIDPDRWHVRIATGGRSSLWPWWRMRGASNPGWVIYANDRDGARIVSGGRSYPLGAGRVVVIPPDTPFDCEPGPETRQVWFHLDLIGLPSGAARELLSRPLDLGDDPILRAQSAHLHATMPDMRGPPPIAAVSREQPLAALAFVHQALARLIELAPHASRLAWADRVRANSPLSPALHVIEDQLARPIYTAELAARCRMGPQWFSARFRAATGLTPAQYVLERRTAVAATRLAVTDESIDDIAVACGFVDRAHFTRVFTRRRGIAPAAYRKRERI